MVEEKEDRGAGPEQFVVEINVKSIAHEASLSILNHHISVQQNVMI